MAEVIAPAVCRMIAPEAEGDQRDPP